MLRFILMLKIKDKETVHKRNIWSYSLCSMPSIQTCPLTVVEIQTFVKVGMHDIGMDYTIYEWAQTKKLKVLSLLSDLKAFRLNCPWIV